MNDFSSHRKNIVAIRSNFAPNGYFIMSTHKLEHFSLEKVSDPELVAALQYPHSGWPFVRMAPSQVGRGVWDQSDESKQRIEDEIAYLTRSTS